MFDLFKSKEVTRVIQDSLPNARPLAEDATLEQLGTELRQLYAQESSNHHRMGEIYNLIVDNKLAEKSGYKDARHYFSEQFADLSQAVLSTYGAVAAEFSEPLAQRFGVNCLALLLSYKEAADLDINLAEPGPTLIEVPDDKGQVTAKPFGQCSVEDMRRALRRKRKPALSKPLPPEAEARAEQYHQAVTGRFPKGTRAEVALRNYKGKAVLDFKGIPWEQVEQLIEVLTSQLAAQKAAKSQLS